MGDLSLFQSTAMRVKDMEGVSSPLVVCNEEHRFMVAEQLQELGIEPTGILLEPAGRNTAPAIALAAQQSLKAHDDAVMMVLPADHVFASADDLTVALEKAVALAQNDYLVTLGIETTMPATGYGYIKKGSAIDKSGFQIDTFTEKPDQETAEKLHQSADHLWNSGIFVLKASTYLRELGQTEPGIVEICKAAVNQAVNDLDFTRIGKDSYAGCKNISVDYAVMEHTDRGAVIPYSSAWSDVGTWSALWNEGRQDNSGNVVVGDGLTVDSKNCYLHSESRLVTAYGVENLVIAETHDTVMVTTREQSEGVKTLVEVLEGEERPEAQLHRKVYRPWGNYDSVDTGSRFQVKRITIKGGQATSMQKHVHRAEHWIVVSGTAEVTLEDDTFLITENESTYIPVGAKHRLRNPGKVPLELIEVQTGAYLGEDDIVRFDDDYGRD